MTTDQLPIDQQSPADRRRRDLFELYGPLVNGRAVVKLLGFRSYSSFAKTRSAGQLPIKVFEIQGRHGPFARTLDIADWLETLGDQPLVNSPSDAV